MAKKPEVAIKPDEGVARGKPDLHTLLEAEKIKADQKRYAKAQAIARKKMMEVAKVASDDD